MRLFKIAVLDAELNHAGHRGIRLEDVPSDAVIVRAERRPDFRGVWDVVYYVTEAQ